MSFKKVKTSAGREFKANLHTYLKTRLMEYEGSKECRITTLLDPRMKKAGFRNTKTLDKPESPCSGLADTAVLDAEEEPRQLEPKAMTENIVAEQPNNKAKTDSCLSPLNNSIAKQSGLNKRVANGSDQL
jgi:hypothetical protein